jgi:hypothetical protein
MIGYDDAGVVKPAALFVDHCDFRIKNPLRGPNKYFKKVIDEIENWIQNIGRIQCLVEKAAISSTGRIISTDYIEKAQSPF